jgi:hypothetical protein
MPYMFAFNLILRYTSGKLYKSLFDLFYLTTYLRIGTAPVTENVISVPSNQIRSAHTWAEGAFYGST